MNVEAINYSVLACFLGMGVVFSFLAFLCVFMIFLKKVLDNPKPEKNNAGETTGRNETASAVASALSSDDTWIIAAVAAYLEEEDVPISAMAWTPSASEKQEPWVTVPRIQKRLARA